ncbi:MAG: hypothetical protein Q9164_007922, partial [Protoblastenia rupestris]
MSNDDMKEIVGEESMSGLRSRTDLFSEQRAYQALHQNDQTQQRGASDLPESQFSRNLIENEDAMRLSPRRPHTMSSEQGARSNPTQLSHGNTGRGMTLVQSRKNQRTELKALGAKLKHARSTQASDAAEHERQMRQKDEEFRRCHLKISGWRVSFDSYTRQKLILEPSQDSEDADIVDTYERLCTAIEEWEEIQFGDFDNPLKSLQQIPLTPAGTSL